MRQTSKLRDGRTLEWADNGIKSSDALIFEAGTTLGLDAWNAWLHKAAAMGVRAISINRPGVGSSSNHEGRQIIDDSADILDLVEILGITKFVAVGWSGGGGRALGAAFFDQCVAVHTIACIPWQDPNDSHWMVTVTPQRHELTTASRADFEELKRRRGGTIEDDRKVTSEDMLAALPSFVANFEEFKNDYRVFAEDFSASIREALVHGPDADAHDYAANINLWGFRLEDVSKPVTLWHGELDDDVEFFYGEYNQSRIPGSTLIRLEGLGHIDIIVEARDRILNAAIASLKE